MSAPSGEIFRPDESAARATRVWKFMETHGIKSYDELISRAARDQDWFWPAALEDLGIEFFTPWTRLKDDSAGVEWTKWFVGGRLNIVHNTVDKHAKSHRATQNAYIWEGDGGEVRTLTYAQLSSEVAKVANALRAEGIGRGDCVGIYMPMLPEVVIAFYATMRVGAIAIPVFSGFAAPAVATRLEDAEAKILFTSDGVFRRGRPADLKSEADAAARSVKSVRRVVVFRRTGADVPWDTKKDVWWEDFVKDQREKAPIEHMDSEDPAMIIYTSGTTGKPKGAVHCHAGALAQMTKEVGYFFDVRAGRDRFFWVTDIGWMMGPWMMIGTNALGATAVLFEGAPNHPNPDRLWETVERHKVTGLGISPTAIRVMRKAGDEWAERHEMASLRILGSTGEAWDPDSWTWYFEKVGKRRCAVINISGGTEIVGCFLAPLPICDLKPCTLRGPGLGMSVEVWDDSGKPVPRGQIGYLVATKHGPSMTRGLWKASERYLETYWSKFKGVWFHGDWASVDEDGFWFLHGRADDTIKIAGKRLGPAEVESALLGHEAVAEAAAIGVPDETKGEALVCFVVLKDPGREGEDLRGELAHAVVAVLGKTLAPKRVHFVSALPKTRSAKIVRRAIKARYLGDTSIGDLTSVENPDSVEEIGRAR
jgi:acetyl-CoA synthetase